MIGVARPATATVLVAGDAGVGVCVGVGVVRPDLGGSSGVSCSGVSECRPTGFRGRRRVPLLGFGSAPIVSQMILYSSIFSINSELAWYALE